MRAKHGTIEPAVGASGKCLSMLRERCDWTYPSIVSSVRARGSTDLGADVKSRPPGAFAADTTTVRAATPTTSKL